MSPTEFDFEVKRTYLELAEPGQFVRPSVDNSSARIDRIQPCPLSFFRYLYREVGREYHWIDRLEWSDEQISNHLSQPGVSIWAMYASGSPAGYFELNHAEDGSTEIAYFGLLPEFIGRGLGKLLLTRAVDEAWATGASRVWLHTCSLDDPAAMPNYLKRGFRPFKEETYNTTLTREELARVGSRR